MYLCIPLPDYQVYSYKPVCSSILSTSINNGPFLLPKSAQPLSSGDFFSYHCLCTQPLPLAAYIEIQMQGTHFLNAPLRVSVCMAPAPSLACDSHKEHCNPPLYCDHLCPYCTSLLGPTISGSYKPGLIPRHISQNTQGNSLHLWLTPLITVHCIELLSKLCEEKQGEKYSVYS